MSRSKIAEFLKNLECKVLKDKIMDNDYKQNVIKNLRRSMRESSQWLSLAKMSAETLGDKSLSKSLKRLHKDLEAVQGEVDSKLDSHRG